MPLVIICGYPGTGKTQVSKQIVDFFKDKVKSCVLVSDEDLLQTHQRDKLYAGKFLTHGLFRSQTLANL